MWTFDPDYSSLKTFVYKHGGFVKIVGFWGVFIGGVNLFKGRINVYHFRKTGIVEGKFDRVLYLRPSLTRVLYGNRSNYPG